MISTETIKHCELKVKSRQNHQQKVNEMFFESQHKFLQSQVTWGKAVGTDDDDHTKGLLKIHSSDVRLLSLLGGQLLEANFL